MKVILPDTNIILWTFKNGPDFREEIGRIAPDHNIMIPTCIIDELEKLDTKESRAALSLCESIENIEILAIEDALENNNKNITSV